MCVVSIERKQIITTLMRAKIFLRFHVQFSFAFFMCIFRCCCLILCRSFCIFYRPYFQFFVNVFSRLIVGFDIYVCKCRNNTILLVLVCFQSTHTKSKTIMKTEPHTHESNKKKTMATVISPLMPLTTFICLQCSRI